MVVGIRQTRSATSTVSVTGRPCAGAAHGVGRVGEQRHGGQQEDDGERREQDVERDLVRRLLPLRALDQRDHAVEEGLARVGGDADDEPVGEHARAAGDGAAVAAALADHRRALAGDGALVDRGDALDHLAVAGDRGRPASTSTRSPRRRLGGGTSSTAASRRGRGEALGARPPGGPGAACRPAPCRGPRPSPRRSCAKSTVNQSQSETARMNRPGLSPPPRDERVRRTAAVVKALPTSTTNITGLRTSDRGSSLRNGVRGGAPDERAVEGRAAFGSRLMALLRRSGQDAGARRSGPSASAGMKVSAPTSSDRPDEQQHEQRRVGGQRPGRGRHGLLARQRAGDGEHGHDDPVAPDEHARARARWCRSASMASSPANAEPLLFAAEEKA